MRESGPRAPSHPLFELTRARVLEFIRDPAALFWVFLFPVLLAVVLGVAFREAPEERPAVAVVVTPANRIAALLEADDTVDARVMTRAAAELALRKGDIDLIVWEATGGAGADAADAEAEVRTDADAALPGLVFRYDPIQPRARLAKFLANAAVQRGLGRVEVATVRDDHVTEVGSRYIDFLLPGLIGLNLLGSSMWGIGFAVVDTRRRRLLKRFAVTPMHRSHYVLAFMLSRMAFLAAELALLLLFGWLVFDVGVRGSLIDVVVASFVGSLCFTGLAVMVAARTSSTEVAAGWINFVMMPMWLVSGAFFSYSRFPDALEPFIRALPLTALNDVLRAIMNEGASLLSMPLEIGVMLAWTVAGFAVALKRFRWQ